MPDEQNPDDNQPPAPASAGADDEGSAAPAGFTPEAIAARVGKLGGEAGDLDRSADDEERKLHERRKKQKRGLEEAASKRLSKIGEGKVKRPSSLSAGLAPESDPLVRRAARAGAWIQEHQQAFAAIVAVGILGAMGFAGYAFWQDKREGQASVLLAQALTDEHGRVGDATAADDDDDKAKPLYPTFKSAAERRDAALAKYRAVESKYPGTGAALLGRLAEGSLLLDAGDAKGAIAAFESVKSSPLGKADDEVRGRALEGIGFADEALAKSDAAGRAKHLDDALLAYRGLEHVDTNGFKELGMYHQARVLVDEGDKAKAIDLLKDVHRRVTEPGESHPFSYLQFVVEDRLRELDPTALPPKVSANAGNGKVDMNDPQVKKLLEQLRGREQKGGAPLPGGAPK